MNKKYKILKQKYISITKNNNVKKYHNYYFIYKHYKSETLKLKNSLEEEKKLKIITIDL